MNLEDLLGIQTRRRFLQTSAYGVGMIALQQLLASEAVAAEAIAAPDPLAPKAPHFPGKAKNVIFLFMSGGPSQLDLFDPKPELEKWHGKSLPPSLTKDLQLAFVKPNAACMASSHKFTASGKSGTMVSDLLPHTATAAD